MPAPRTTIAVAVAVMCLLAGCTSGGDAQPDAGRPATPPTVSAEHTGDAQTVAAYAAVVRQLITKDHSYGTRKPPFRRIFVIDHAETFPGQESGPLSEAVQAGLLEALADLLPAEFVPERQAALVSSDSPPFRLRDGGVIISVGPIERVGSELHVAGHLYCGSKCGRHSTYVLAFTKGAWRITGTTGMSAVA